MPQPQLVHYLPIATTVLSAAFCAVLFHRYAARKSALHLLWWGIGILMYGVGTAFESAITLFGNSAGLTKAWYVAGALLGGYPLAQGTVFLLLPRRSAWILTAATLPIIATVAVLVLLSPIFPERLEPHRPSGAIFVWQWLRLFTPIINLYAFVFLVGGAILSAVRYARRPGTENRDRALGNSLIAIGAILPGIGGGMAKAGMVEALYVGEFVGILLIWAGYRKCVRPNGSSSEPANPKSRTALAPDRIT